MKKLAGVIGLLLSGFAFLAAQVLPDAPVELLVDSCQNLTPHFPGEIVPLPESVIPANDLYLGLWDNLNIRYNRQLLPLPSDTLIIPLHGPGDNCFVVPIIGRVTSPFMSPRRRYHTGTDVKLFRGDTVRCAFDGRVRLARYYHGYGNMVLVRHHNGLETLYGHLQKILVKENQNISAGEIIGLGGRTGRATTEHLHFETRIFGIPFDSEKYIDFATGTLKTDTLYYLGEKVAVSLEEFNLPGSSRGDLLAESTSAPQVYTIRKGDTLSAIARRYNTTVNQLCQANNIRPDKILRIGQTLIIP